MGTEVIADEIILKACGPCFLESAWHFGGGSTMMQNFHCLTHNLPPKPAQVHSEVFCTASLSGFAAVLFMSGPNKSRGVRHVIRPARSRRSPMHGMLALPFYRDSLLGLCGRFIHFFSCVIPLRF